MAIRAVFFDVGETLICEDRIYRSWAEWYAVPALTFLGVLGAVIADRRDHLDVFRYFDDSFDLDAAQAARRAAGVVTDFTAADLYPDALPTLRVLKAAGYVVGVAGNQPPNVTEQVFGECGVALDVIASSAGWGVTKPDPEFFTRVAATAGLPATDIAYVGDRVDNDVLPARAAGMAAVFLRRGPWGLIHAEWPEAGQACVRIESLDALPAALQALA